jgi:putative ABC transport system permease protein
LRAAFILFSRLMVRPLWREPLRTMLTVFAVALGVAVVVAIELAGEAATGSFRSSLESLSGDADFEISAVGGLEEELLGELAALPYPMRVSPRVEGTALVQGQRRSVAVLGLDLVGDTSIDHTLWRRSFNSTALTTGDSVWVGRRVASRPGETLRLMINGASHDFVVRAVLASEGLSGLAREDLVVMDIATAQRVFSRQGLLDRIEVRLPKAEGTDWEGLLRGVLPAGVTLRRRGARTAENRKMLSAFRWNLRVLSYISLVVGAFLIYYTISVSVVRRQTEIGILRAVGTTRFGVMAAFLTEAAFFGFLGTLLGLALGRVMANGAVGLMAATVSALYVSSTPGEIQFSYWTFIVAAMAGIGITLLAALAPAREAARVPPTDAMASGRRHYVARLRVGRDLAWGVLLAGAACAASFAPPIEGKPLFGYLAALLLIAGAALATPALVTGLIRMTSGAVERLMGVEGMLASRSLLGSLARTAVLVSTLSTAVAMMASVGIMVGSFRDTVSVWLENRLGADLYLRPAGSGGIDSHPTLDPGIADRIEALDGVSAVDRFRAYPITYNGLPATLGAGQSHVFSRTSNLRFLSGNRERIMNLLPTGDYVVISEPFAYKHDLDVGDAIQLPLRGRAVQFEVIGVYYDYANERGYVIADRDVLLQHLPDPAPSNLAIYVKPGIDLTKARVAIEGITAGRDVFIAGNRRLRAAAMEVFDRTFAITYALEAVAILVAIMGMAGALMALVIDRRREIAVLRFLGATGTQVRRLILAESGLLGLMANVLGLAVGTLLSLILIYVINKQSFGWTIQFHWPVTLLLSAMSLIYLAAILAGLYPARVAARLNPIEVVHEE